MAKYPAGKRKKVGTPKIVSRSKAEKDPSSYVLRMLLNASPYYVSGSVLAQKLKMSQESADIKTLPEGKIPQAYRLNIWSET